MTNVDMYEKYINSINTTQVYHTDSYIFGNHDQKFHINLSLSPKTIVQKNQEVSTSILGIPVSFMDQIN